jgi:hypothetical protein
MVTEGKETLQAAEAGWKRRRDYWREAGTVGIRVLCH